MILKFVGKAELRAKSNFRKSKGRHNGVPNQKARSGMETEQRVQEFESRMAESKQSHLM